MKGQQNKFLASYQYIINLGPFHNQHFTINTTYTEIIAALGYIYCDILAIILTNKQNLSWTISIFNDCPWNALHLHLYHFKNSFELILYSQCTLR